MPAIRVYLLTLSVLLGALTAACGGGSDEPGGGGDSDIESFDEVQSAVIRIETTGTFRDPEVGLANGSGSGSGFIISPDGLAVTNNHVVAGAATLEVFIGGDQDKSYNATILGVSECNDLALIDIRESEPLPYLDWHDDEIVAGLDVYAAGFPLGDPQFTLTRGIVSKAKADGDITGTSSIDHTLEHDANIHPGNSGGPLVSTSGQVVGVNYAGGANVTTTAQFFAIASQLAQPVVEQLKTGDYESLGINGWAVFDGEIFGVWVAGVAPGSPASKVGLLPGDIVTSMNGAPVGDDGTLAQYCDVIRTAGVAKPIAIEALRYDTGEYLRGEINGDKPLSIIFTPSDDLEEAPDNNQGSAEETYSGYTTLTDATNAMTVEVPDEWDDIELEPFDLDGEQIPYIAAAPDLDDFFNTYGTSGMEFAVFSLQDDLEATVQIFAPGEGECEDQGSVDYNDGYYEGVRHVWDACGTSEAVYVVLAAVPIGVPAEESFTAVLLVQLTTDADYEALDRMFATFDVFQ
jgi:serine protease Do